MLCPTCNHPLEATRVEPATGAVVGDRHLLELRPRVIDEPSDVATSDGSPPAKGRVKLGTSAAEDWVAEKATPARKSASSSKSGGKRK